MWEQLLRALAPLVTKPLLEPDLGSLDFPDSFELVKILGEMQIQLYSGKNLILILF